MATGFSKEHQRWFDAAQNDEKFRSWVDMNEAVLELEFDDVPGLGERPWGKADLDIAEKRYLELVPNAQQSFDPDHQALSWRFVRFLGQTYVDNFEGEWVNMPRKGNRHAYIGVRLPFRGMYLDLIGTLTSTANRRTGHEWSQVFLYAEEDYAGWRR